MWLLRVEFHSLVSDVVGIVTFTILEQTSVKLTGEKTGGCWSATHRLVFESGTPGLHLDWGFDFFLRFDWAQFESDGGHVRPLDGESLGEWRLRDHWAASHLSTVMDAPMMARLVAMNGAKTDISGQAFLYDICKDLSRDLAGNPKRRRSVKVFFRSSPCI